MVVSGGTSTIGQIGTADRLALLVCECLALILVYRWVYILLEEG